jgi:hypothetical protein
MREKETRSEQRMNESLQGEILRNMYCTYRSFGIGEEISGLSYVKFSLFTVATRFLPKQARRILPYWELLNIQFRDVRKVKPSSRRVQYIFNLNFYSVSEQP